MGASEVGIIVAYGVLSTECSGKDRFCKGDRQLLNACPIVLRGVVREVFSGWFSIRSLSSVV